MSPNRKRKRDIQDCSFDIGCGIGLKRRKKTVQAPILRKYKCCGVNNYTDWQGVYDIHNFKTLPDSCCGYSGCGQSGAQVSYLISCYDDAKEWIMDNFYLIGATGIAIGVLQLILVFVSFALIFCIRKEKSYKYA